MLHNPKPPFHIFWPLTNNLRSGFERGLVGLEGHELTITTHGHNFSKGHS